MADAMTGVTEIAAVSAALIESMVQSYLQNAMVITPTLQPIQAPKGSLSVAIPRLAGFTVDDKSEGVAVSAQANTWSADTLSLNKHKVIQVLVEKIAEVQSQPNLMMAYAERMGMDLADAIDVFVISELVQASASAPDHRVAFAGSTMAATDIVNAATLLDIQKVPKTERFLAVNPVDHKALLLIDNFVRYDAYGSSAALINGAIGKVYGFEVIASNNITASSAIAYHRSACAVAIQAAPSYQEQVQLEYLATRASIDVIFGAKILDSGKRCVKIGSAS